MSRMAPAAATSFSRSVYFNPPWMIPWAHALPAAGLEGLGRNHGAAASMQRVDDPESGDSGADHEEIDGLGSTSGIS